MLKPCAIAIPITIRSINMLNAKTGRVIFVGMAARLVTRLIPIATMATTNKVRLVPASKTAITVNGVKIHP